MESIWPLLKLLISLEGLVVWTRQWIISRQQEEDQKKLEAACDLYKSASNDVARIAAARKIQESLRKKS